MFPAYCLNRLTQLELIPPVLEWTGAVGDFIHVGFSGLVAFIFAPLQLANQLAKSGFSVNSFYQEA